MIEFELKYQLSDNHNSICNLELLSQKKDRDIYFDTVDSVLIRNGNFLRVRNDSVLDFKVDLGDDSHLYVDETSFEVNQIAKCGDDILTILRRIGIEPKYKFENMDEFIESCGFVRIAKIIKERKKYKFEDNINIFFDLVEDLGFFLEAEIILNDIFDDYMANEIKENIERKLVDANLICKSDINISVGYVELYLLKYNKSIYDLGKFKL